jgi:hypothetical protein
MIPPGPNIFSRKRVPQQFSKINYLKSMEYSPREKG